MYLHLIDRATAKKYGLKYYFTGSVCVRKNISARYSASGACMCVPCHEARRASAKITEKKSPDKKQARAARYREKNRIEIRARMREYSVKSASVRAEYAQKNKEKLAENAKVYRKQNSEMFKAHCANRRAERICRTPKWFGELDYFVVSEAASLCIARKSATGHEWHIDHSIPLRCDIASGLHCADNIQVIPAKINRYKKNRMMITEPLEWIKYL